MAELRVGDRLIEWCSDGPEDGPLVIYFHGTPIGMRLDGPTADAIVHAGARLVGFSRAGYRSSTRQPGRTIADVADDVRALLGEFGRDRYSAIGWSGGGPHALAAAALVPGCSRVVIVAGLAPFAGFDWRDGMNESGVGEAELAMQGEAAFREATDPMAPLMAGITGEMIVAEPSPVMSSGDLAVLKRAGVAEQVAASMRSGLAGGPDGNVDDNVAFVAEWGFEPNVDVPVVIWQGEEDRMVPVGHGRRLAELIPGADLRVIADEGHISILFNHADEIAESVLG